MNDLARLLAHRSKRDEWPVGSHSGFLDKFPLGGLERAFPVFDHPFRDRPRTFIALRPKWPAGMGKEEFEGRAGATVKEESCAFLRLPHPELPCAGDHPIGTLVVSSTTAARKKCR